MDAVIYLLDFQEFNSISRRAFNQQQVLYNCIVEEMRRGSPHLYQRHVVANNSPSPTFGLHGSVPFAALKAPWTNAVQLKRHLLSDPTSKSRDKFVGIIESLFKHPAFALTDPTLAATFEKLVLKVAFVFKNVLLGVMPSTTVPSSLPVDCSSDSSFSPRDTAGRKRRLVADRRRHEDEEDCDEKSLHPDAPGSVPNARSGCEEPPRKMRYVTRSSTDGSRSDATAADGAAFECRQLLEKRLVRQHMPLIRPDMRPVSSSNDHIKVPDPAEDHTAPGGDYVFDSALFDDHQMGTDLDCEPWDFLDDWAWQHSTGPTVVTYTALHAPRPSHPLPLPGVGLTLQGQPVTHANQHALSAFRSIAHTTVPSFSEFGRALGFQPSTTLWAERPSSPPPSEDVPRSSPSASASASTFCNAVPFPDHGASPMHTRRTTFYRPVTPEPLFRHLGSTDASTALLPVPVSAALAQTASAPGPLSESVHSAVSDSASWSDSDALSSCMTLDSQYVQAMGQLGVHERGQSPASGNVRGADAAAESICWL